MVVVSRVVGRLAGYGQTAELHALMAHGASMGISRGVTTLLDELAEIKPTLLYAVPQLFKRVCDAIHAKVLHYSRYTIYTLLILIAATLCPFRV